MPATERGIYHNLKESEYTISNNEVVFFFSSELYRRKFLERYEQYRSFFNDKLAKIVGESSLNYDVLSDIRLYEDIEKRGFYVWIREMEITKEELEEYALRKMNDKESFKWKKIRRSLLKEKRVARWQKHQSLQ